MEKKLRKIYLSAYNIQIPIYRLFMIPYIQDQELKKSIYRKIQEIINHFKHYLNYLKEKGLILELDYQRFSEIIFSKLLAKSLEITSLDDNYVEKVNEFSSCYSKQLAELLIKK